jgi:uncharacterized cupredoxin-like copper-binding protein
MTRHIYRETLRTYVVALVALLATIALASCASSQGKIGTTQVTPTARGSAVEVILKDYEILMPESVPAGEVTFSVTNAGNHFHDFEVEVNGQRRHVDNGVKPGETRTLVVALTPGTYSVECPVGMHEQRGMRRKLTVTGQR